MSDDYANVIRFKGNFIELHGRGEGYSHYKETDVVTPKDWLRTPHFTEPAEGFTFEEMDPSAGLTYIESVLTSVYFRFRIYSFAKTITPLSDVIKAVKDVKQKLYPEEDKIAADKKPDASVLARFEALRRRFVNGEITLKQYHKYICQFRTYYAGNRLHSFGAKEFIQ
jgi:hypothetical protein